MKCHTCKRETQLPLLMFKRDANVPGTQMPKHVAICSECRQSKPIDRTSK